MIGTGRQSAIFEKPGLWHRGLWAAMLLAGAMGGPDAATAVAQEPVSLQDTVHYPVPAPVVPPAFFKRAIAAGTRTADGSPGPRYWQQWTTYDIQAKLDPATAHLTGSVTIDYQNRSPRTLQQLDLHLYQNLQAQGVPRNDSEQVTGGIKLHRVVVDSQEIAEGNLSQGPAYRIDGTVMTLRPGWPVQPGDTVQIQIDFEETLPQSGSGRMGYSDHDVYLVAYWFPKMAVYDDLRGWDAQPYLGRAEFYEGYGDYNVALTVPAGWTAMATGTLQNPTDVYTPQTLDRLARADSSDDRVVVATPAEIKAGSVTAAAPQGTLTYRFKADSVRDFTWTTSNVQEWDATSALVPDRDGDGKKDRVRIDSFWRVDRAPLWVEEWKYAKESIEFHSEYTGFPYPWPHMTSVEGADIIGGGMEFPMMTLMGSYSGRQPSDLFGVTAHELGHMWIPMIVGSNENRHAWIDEGSTTYLEDQSEMTYLPGIDHHRIEAQPYLQVAKAGQEESMMRGGDYYPPGPSYTVASYSKPATLMVALRELMGKDTWEQAYRAFISEWAFKHPTPWDFFNTFERFANKDLDWFWTSYYYETWTMDQDVVGVETGRPGGPVVIVRNNGFAPYPSTLWITTTNKGVVERTVSVDQWLKSGGRVEVQLPSDVGAVSRVQLDPGGYAPDLDRTNNFWPRG